MDYRFYAYLSYNRMSTVDDAIWSNDLSVVRQILEEQEDYNVDNEFIVQS